MDERASRALKIGDLDPCVGVQGTLASGTEQLDRIPMEAMCPQFIGVQALDAMCSQFNVF